MVIAKREGAQVLMPLKTAQSPNGSGAGVEHARIVATRSHRVEFPT